MPGKLIAVTIYIMLTQQPVSPTTSTVVTSFQDYDACVAARDVLRGEGKIVIGDREFRSKTRAECFRDGEAAPESPEGNLPPTQYDILPGPGRGPNIRVPEQHGSDGPPLLSGPYRWPQDH